MSRPPGLSGCPGDAPGRHPGCLGARIIPFLQRTLQARRMPIIQRPFRRRDGPGSHPATGGPRRTPTSPAMAPAMGGAATMEKQYTTEDGKPRRGPRRTAQTSREYPAHRPIRLPGTPENRPNIKRIPRPPAYPAAGDPGEATNIKRVSRPPAHPAAGDPGEATNIKRVSRPPAHPAAGDPGEPPFSGAHRHGPWR